MTAKSPCPACDDFGRVEAADSLLLPCPEPGHGAQKALCPWDGPTAGEQMEERCGQASSPVLAVG